MRNKANATSVPTIEEDQVTLVYSDDLEQGNADGSVDVTGAAAVDRGIAVHRQELVEPVIVAEPDADYDRGSLELGEIGRSRLERFRVGCRRDDGLDLREVAGYCLCKAREIAGSGDHAHAAG